MCVCVCVRAHVSCAFACDLVCALVCMHVFARGDVRASRANLAESLLCEEPGALIEHGASSQAV